MEPFKKDMKEGRMMNPVERRRDWRWWVTVVPGVLLLSLLLMAPWGRAQTRTLSQADLLIKRGDESDEAFAINDVYQTTPSGDQIEMQTVAAGKAAIYQVKMEADSDNGGFFDIYVRESGGMDWAVTYKLGNVELEPTNIGFLYGTVLSKGESSILTIRMLALDSALSGASMSTTFVVLRDDSDTPVLDAVQAMTTVSSGVSPSPTPTKTVTPVPTSTATVTPTPRPSTAKNRTSGCTPCAKKTGEPVQAATGEYFTEPQVDINLGGPLPLAFIRSYASRLTTEGAVQSSLGDNWMHNIDLKLNNITSDSLDVVYLLGKIIPFQESGNDWSLKNSEEVIYQLKEDTSGDFYLMVPGQNLVYHFSGTTGYLTEIKDRNENTLTITRDTSGKITEITDGLGRTLSFTYDDSNNLTQITDGTRTCTYSYTDGVLTEFTDALGNTTTYVYDTDNETAGPLMTYIIYPLGNRHHIQTYDSKGRVKEQTDAFNNTYDFKYDKPKKGKTTIIDPLGNSTVSTHEDQKVMTAEKDALGKTLNMDYDDNSRPTSLKDTLGNTTSMTYHEETGFPASMTDANGNTSSVTYTTQSQTFGTVAFTFYNLTRIDYPDDTYESFTYDAKGNVLSTVDRAGSTWTYTYDSQGQVLTKANPEGGVITYTYNSDGTRASDMDTDTGVTTYEYDSLKRLIKVTHPDDAYAQMTYDSNDRVTSKTTENGRTVSFTHDANGNLTTTTDPDGNETQYTYDTMDRLVEITNYLGKVTTSTYDDLGRIESSADPNGNTTSYTYNENGWVTKVTDGMGKVWNTVYDNAGLIDSEKSPLGNVTRYEKNSVVNITKITDPRGNSMNFTYDPMSRLTTSADAAGRKVDYSYDKFGLVANAIQNGLGSARYTRNKLGLLASITDLRGKGWSFGYTDAGRLSSQNDPLGNEWEYAYDSRGRLSTTTYPTNETKTVTYDSGWNVTQINYSDGTTLQFSYDDLDRMTSADDITLGYDAEGNVTNTSDGSVSFGATYDDGERLKTVTYNPALSGVEGNDAFTVTYTYDKRDLLTKVTDSLTNTTIDLTYDDDGRLTNLSRSNGITTTYSYDKAGRVTGIQDGSIASQNFTLNAVGDIVTDELTLPMDTADVLSSDTVTLSFDDASQINSSGYTYDTKGRQTASPGDTFTWDIVGRLTDTGNATLAYNGMNDLRLGAEGEETIHYYYNYAIVLKPIVAEKDENTGQFLRYYVWAPEGTLLYMIDAQDGNKVYFYHLDRVGSTLFLTDAEGSVTDSYAYTPYGIMLGHNGSSAQPFTYIGKYGVRQEGTNGLYHMRARYFDAVTARFISRDPAWPLIMQPGKLNPYQYAEENPVNVVDPDGRDGEQDSWFWRGVAWYAGKGTVFDTIVTFGEKKNVVVGVKEAELESMGEATAKGKALEKLKKEYLKKVLKEVECSKELHGETEVSGFLTKFAAEVGSAKSLKDINKAKEKYEKDKWEWEKKEGLKIVGKELVKKVPGVSLVVEGSETIVKTAEKLAGDK